MGGKVPGGKLRRCVIGGVAAARVGGNMVGYLARKPFLSEQGRLAARRKLDQAGARTVFACLGLLKGTALKVAQQLSMELELFPEAVRAELRKSYNQVPPMNRVLARKAARNALGRPPEEIFGTFEATAFAAASLGQVHRAATPGGEPLAVKLQYPGIARTIEDDMQLIRGVARTLSDRELLLPVLDEIRERLLEEIDYRAEARNLEYFARHLDVEGVTVPSLWAPGCGDTALSAGLCPGLPLNQWLETDPSQDERELVAKRLNDVFLQSFYELRCIHADPNPGNYIVGPDCSVGLVDFGCVKRFSPEFVEDYRQLVRAVIQGRRDEHMALLRKMRFFKDSLDAEAEAAILECARDMGHWLAGLYEPEVFDFSRARGYLGRGREMSRALLAHRRHFVSQPDFVYLDRTRYGLLRIFESLGCKVRLRNLHECEESAP